MPYFFDTLARAFGRATIACIAATAAPALLATNLFFSDANGLVLHDTGGFRGSLNFNQNLTSAGFSLVDTGFTESWTASANVSAGQLKAVASANNSGPGSAFADAYTSVIAAFGDTVTYSGTASGGAPVTTNIGVSGSWATNASGNSTLLNYSYLRIYFLRPGSFDTASILAPGNIILDSSWGIGPGAVPDPLSGITFA